VLATLSDHVQKANIINDFKDFFTNIDENPLRTWLLYFDENNDQRISYGEFHMGMLRLGFDGDDRTIFEVLDTDGSGEISLEEIDEASARLWVKFRAWALNKFDSAKDLMQTLTGGMSALTQEVFAQGLKDAGWTSGMEDMLYLSIDTDGCGHISLGKLKWFQIDKKRLKRKEEAKARHAKVNDKKIAQQHAARATLQDFKQHLLSHFGNYLRAWRRCIDPEGMMVAQKKQIFKACRDIDWEGDMRLLWKAMDEGGCVRFEELDANAAEKLARLHGLVTGSFGGSEAAFRWLDRHNQQRLTKAEFLAGISEAGLDDTKGLFEGLDWQNKKFLSRQDLFFLDAWKPPAFLGADQNPEAVDEFRELFLAHYEHYLKGWRAMDRDNSNRASWQEFANCCEQIGFKGDAAGAWRALDDDLSGFITLREVDDNAAEILIDFKKWADEEFGGVRSAFQVLDHDSSNEVPYTEFRRAVRNYGFTGDIRRLFLDLDYEGHGYLRSQDICFLDAWDLKEEEQDVEFKPEDFHSPAKKRASKADIGTVRLPAESPAPGSYEIPSTFGMRGIARLPPQDLGRRGSQTARLPILAEAHQISPAKYDVLEGLKQASWVRQKPRYSFSRSSRPSNDPLPREKDPRGPGNYAPVSPHAAIPRLVDQRRRSFRAHPLMRMDSD